MRALAFSGGKDSMACLHLMRETLDCAIYIDTGFAYPETMKMVEYAATILPLSLIHSDRQGQNDREGIPADIVPVEWTPLGQKMTYLKAITIQPSLSCCYENLARPLLDYAKSIGVTELVYGQRSEESHRGTAKHGDMVEGIMRVHPIESWTRQDVLDYLRTKMELPDHYWIRHSSLDCYDCTAFAKESSDRITWMKERYPSYYLAYAHRANALVSALQEAL